MDLLRTAYGMLPRSLWGSGERGEQVVLSTKTAVSSLLCAAGSLQTCPDSSELPYYGLSPPVYPSRKFCFLLDFPLFFAPFPLQYLPPEPEARPVPTRPTNTPPQHAAKALPTSAGPPPSARRGPWSPR